MFFHHALLKWSEKSRGRAHISTSAPYNFLYFSQQYTVHIMARRKKKSTWIFSCARVRITASPFSPANMCIYIMVTRRKTTERLRWLVTVRIDHGHILPMVDVNSAQIGTGGATRLWWNLRSQLARLMLYRQVLNRQPRIILRWKNVWMYTNLLRKMWWCKWIFIWKNVNDIDFDTNINLYMCMKVMLLFIYIKMRIVYIYISIYIMRIAIFIIYVHDDVDVSAYEYVNVYDV